VAQVAVFPPLRRDPAAFQEHLAVDSLVVVAVVVEEVSLVEVVMVVAGDGDELKLWSGRRPLLNLLVSLQEHPLHIEAKGIRPTGDRSR
jgi:hypothetical protein